MFRKRIALIMAALTLLLLPAGVMAAGSAPVVTRLDATNISAEGAQLNGAVSCASLLRYTHTGFYLSTDKSNLKEYRFTRNADIRNTSFNISVTKAELQSNYGRLRAGTIYYYKLFVVAGGAEYASDVGWFRTQDNGDSSKTQLTVYEPTDVLMDSAVLHARVTVNSYGFTFKKVGLLLGQSANSMSEIAGNAPANKNNPDIAYRVKEYKFLTPNTTYYYQFFAVTSAGASYVSPVRSFTTLAPSCRVFLYPNGVMQNAVATDVTIGQPYLFDTVPVMNGYVFDGWYTAPTGGSRVPSSGVWSISSDMSLYAHWASATTSAPGGTGEFQLFFDLNYGGLGVTETKLVDMGKKYGTLPEPQREGYAFKGWYTKPEGGSRVKSSTKLKDSQSVTLYAHWSGNGYKVTFDANAPDASVSVTSKTMRFGTTYELPVPTRPNYAFKGWFPYPDVGVQIPQTWTMDHPGRITLYAHWTPVVYNGPYSVVTATPACCG